EPGSAPDAPPLERPPEPEVRAPEPLPDLTLAAEEAVEPAAAERGGKVAARPHTTRETKTRQDKQRSSRR
ncbi:MAG: protein TolA, partial [Planctomycetota bacterium]